MPSYGIQIKQQQDISIKNDFLNKKYVVLDKPIRLLASEYSNNKYLFCKDASAFVYTIYLLRAEYKQNFVYGYVVTKFNHPYYYPGEHLNPHSIHYSTKVGPNWSTSTNTWNLTHRSFATTKKQVRKKILDLISDSYIPIELASAEFQMKFANPDRILTREECHQEMNLIHIHHPVFDISSKMLSYGSCTNYIITGLNNYWKEDSQWSDPSQDLHNLFLRKGKKKTILTKVNNPMENLDEVLF